MTIQLQIPPALETRLQAEASARGEDVETIVVDALLERFGNFSQSNANLGQLSVQELDLALSELAFHGAAHRVDFSRADIYSVHD